MKNNKISVIVPIYNTQMYLERCLNSIINQTYSNLEIILVNDGSTDNSLSIIKKYKENDSRIIIVNKENGGLSSARNAGIDIASGDYISFVDSDDYINIELYEYINKCLNEYEGIDIINFGTTNIDLKENIELDVPAKKQVYNNIEAYKLLNSYVGIGNGAWNKIYSKKIFQNIRFPVGKKCEDCYIVYKLILLSKKVMIVPFKGYYYIKRENSITTSNVNMDYLYAFKEQRDYIEKKYSDLVIYSNSAYFFANEAIFNRFVLFNKEMSEDLLNEFNNNIKNNLKYVLINPKMKISKKIKALLLVYFRPIYRFLLINFRKNKI